MMLKNTLITVFNLTRALSFKTKQPGNRTWRIPIGVPLYT